MMKNAICHTCGKDLHHLIPSDAEEITCYDCNEKAYDRQQERLLEIGGPTRLEQQIAAQKIKRGVR